tara:strand:- start:238 stop:888 length:651 start_codon:yes stop_codon:yes gene_type:complete
VIFSQRKEAMDSIKIFDYSTNFLDEIKKELIELKIQKIANPKSSLFENQIKTLMGKNYNEEELRVLLEKKDDDLMKLISDKFYETRDERIKLLGIDQAKQIEKRIFLQSIDINWKSHIQYLEQLRQVIGLRSYGQRDPLIEYKKEAFTLFENLLKKLKQDYIVVLMNLKFVKTSSGKSEEKTSEEKSINQINKKVKRNEPCPCGSGKKYKKCCGRL